MIFASSSAAPNSTGAFVDYNTYTIHELAPALTATRPTLLRQSARETCASHRPMCDRRVSIRVGWLIKSRSSPVYLKAEDPQLATARADPEFLDKLTNLPVHRQSRTHTHDPPFADIRLIREINENAAFFVAYGCMGLPGKQRRARAPKLHVRVPNGRRTQLGYRTCSR